MNIKEQVLRLLDKKDHPVLVSRQVIRSWKSQNSNPNLNTIEKVIKENDFEVFISDGNLNELLDFNKRIGEKNGWEINLSVKV